MGKTAFFREITQSHFRDSPNAFSAYAKWGCIIVQFAARDFAGGGEDKDDPAWVFDAIKATLSSEQLTSMMIAFYVTSWKVVRLLLRSMD
jgi:hypothetical protein